MKKILKIIGITLGGLLGAVFLTWLILPNLPILYILKYNSLDAEKTAAEDQFADVQIPDDYKEISVNGFTFRVPESVMQDAAHPKLYRTTDESAEEVAGLAYTDVYNDQSLMELAESYFTKKEIARGLRAIKWDTPQNDYEMNDLMLNFRPDDINLTKHGVARFVYWLYSCKTSSYRGDLTVTRMENEQVKGFYTQNAIKWNGEPEMEYIYALQIFDKNNLDHQFYVVVAGKDEATAQAIIHSAAPAPEN